MCDSYCHLGVVRLWSNYFKSIIHLFLSNVSSVWCISLPANTDSSDKQFICMNTVFQKCRMCLKFHLQVAFKSMPPTWSRRGAVCVLSTIIWTSLWLSRSVLEGLWCHVISRQKHRDRNGFHNARAHAARTSGRSCNLVFTCILWWSSTSEGFKVLQHNLSNAALQQSGLFHFFPVVNGIKRKIHFFLTRVLDVRTRVTRGHLFGRG